MLTLISGATIVNEDRKTCGSLLIENDRIAEIYEGDATPRGHYDRKVDAAGCFVLPGVIDDHVHFREPGLTSKADIESESRAAAFGGVTSYFDMPNTIPQTTTPEALDEKLRIAAARSHVNYSFFFGATNDNIHLVRNIDKSRIPGIKLLMGSSTGNMLVDREEALEDIFRYAGMPVMVHCEDTGVINANMAAARAKYGEDPVIGLHPVIRSREACLKSASLAVRLARKYGTRLHVAHVTTAEELALFEAAGDTLPRITAEAVVAHLLFSDRDYARLGALIKCNPAIKSPSDRDALRAALSDGRIAVIGTDHAPHRLDEKQGGCCRAVSGMPMVQFSLVSMLGLVDEGVLSIERLVRLMCHNPADLFGVSGRGYIRRGYKADIVVVRPGVPWTVTGGIIQSKCGWSPLLGNTFRWRVEHTFCNGSHILNNGIFDEDSRGEALEFSR